MIVQHYTHRPCLGLAAGFALGIWLNSIFPSMKMAVMAMTLAVVLLAAVIRSAFWSAVLLVLIFTGIGFLRAHERPLPPEHIAHLTYEERSAPIAVEGVIVSDVDTRRTTRGDKTVFELSIEHVAVEDGWSVRRGKVLVNLFRGEDLEYGERIRLTGKLHKPFAYPSRGHFSYEEYLKRNGVEWILSVKKASDVQVLAHGQGSPLWGFLLKCRHRFQQVLNDHLTDFEAGIEQSLVLGGKYYIPERTRELFVQTGTAHILAISGMNVGGMAFLIFLILNVLRIPRPWQILGTSLILIGYCLLTGANPSVVRATVMAVLMLWAFLFERQADTLNSLGLSALVILLFDPLSLLDIGFQLSFTGVFSIIYLYPKIYCHAERWARGRVRTLLLQSLCISIAAWIGVLPLIGYYFQIVTPGSILANIPIIPFVSALFMLGCGLIIAGLLCPAAAFMFAACIKVVLFALMMIVDLFSRLPLGYVYIKEMDVGVIVAYYIVIGAVFCFLPCFSAGRQASGNLHFLS